MATSRPRAKKTTRSTAAASKATRKTTSTKAKPANSPASERTAQAKPSKTAAKAKQQISPTKTDSSKAKKPVRSAPSRSPRRGTSFSSYVADKAPAPFDEMLLRLHALVVEAVPDARVAIKWGQPVFEVEGSGPFAYMRPSKRHVTFGFWRGADLRDPKGLLEGTGAQMRHIKLEALDDIDATVVRSLVKQAVSLNRSLGDPTRAR